MTQTQAAQLSPETILEEMKKNGITHVVWLPDSETNWLYLLMQAEPSLHLIAVSREGQAFSTAAGLSVGGKIPIILIQNTGLMESGDSHACVTASQCQGVGLVKKAQASMPRWASEARSECVALHTTEGGAAWRSSRSLHQ